MKTKRYNIGDRIYHKEFFWLGTIKSMTGFGNSLDFTHTYVKWDDPDLPNNELVNTEEIDLYDFKGIITGAIHRERTKSKKD